ncbi:MAG: 4'-phosphopantetheinyl transferase family protein [Flavobacteriales bacterium]
MPLVIFSRELKDNALLGVWKATEPTDLLEKIAGLSPADTEKLRAIRLEKRQREWLTSRILLRLMSRGKNLTFLPSGKPILNNAAHISISHSDDLAGVVLASTSIGMDIQEENPKLLKIEQKFTNENERSFLPDDPSRLSYITLIWSAKEAVFKFFGEHVDFARDIHVRPFDPGDSLVYADYTGLHGNCVFELQNHRFGEVNIVTTTQPDLEPV